MLSTGNLLRNYLGRNITLLYGQAGTVCLPPGARDPLKLDSYPSTENGRSLSLDDSISEMVPGL